MPEARRAPQRDPHRQRRHVLIPLAGNKGGAAGLALGMPGIADGKHHFGYEPRLKGLVEAGLPEAGKVAFKRIERLRGHASEVSLSIDNVEAFKSLGRINSKSAELGLALAAMLTDARAGGTGVIATGSLTPPEGGGDWADCTVYPIEGIDRKFEGVAEFLHKQTGAPLTGKVPFFLPVETWESVLATPEYKAAMDAMIESAAALEIPVRIEMQPVASLREAAEKLGALREAPQSRFGRLMRRAKVVVPYAAALAAFVAGTAALWGSFDTTPEFTSVQIGGDNVMTPLRTTYSLRNPTQEARALAPCSVGPMPAYRVGDEITFAGRLPDVGWTGHLHDFSYAFVGGRADTPVVVADADSVHQGGRPRIDDDSDLVFVTRQSVDDPPEPHLLALLSRRLRNIDEAAVAADLTRALEGLSGAKRLRAAEKHLYGLGWGFISYRFEIVDRDHECGMVREASKEG